MCWVLYCMRIVGNSRWIKCAFYSSSASTTASASATSIVMCTLFGLPSSVLRNCGVDRYCFRLVLELAISLSAILP